MARNPDFIVIGAMKAGTTTVFRRLAEVPGVVPPKFKEPHFFSDEEMWNRGVEWYRSVFDHDGGVTGEASPSYSDARSSDLVAHRIQDTVPDARLIFSLRDPIERMRSHYVHQVLKARETRPFPEAVTLKGEYVAKSMYGAVLRSYRLVFDLEQILVFKIDHLDDPDSGVWEELLNHIGAPGAPMPAERYNETSAKKQFTPVLRWMYERGFYTPKWTPRFVRRIGKRLLTRSSDQRPGLVESAAMTPPEPVLAALRADQELLGSLGVPDGLVWDQI
jgi:hypothetical protein